MANDEIMQIDPKDVFANEPELTSWLARDGNSALQELLNLIEFQGRQVTQQNLTTEGKAVDLVVKDPNSDSLVTIEWQTLNGVLDAHHLWKSVGYAVDLGADTNVVVCQKTAEWFKYQVKWLNCHPYMNMFLITYFVTTNAADEDFVKNKMIALSEREERFEFEFQIEVSPYEQNGERPPLRPETGPIVGLKVGGKSVHPLYQYWVNNHFGILTRFNEIGAKPARFRVNGLEDHLVELKLVIGGTKFDPDVRKTTNVHIKLIFDTDNENHSMMRDNFMLRYGGEYENWKLRLLDNDQTLAMTFESAICADWNTGEDPNNLDFGEWEEVANKIANRLFDLMPTN